MINDSLSLIIIMNDEKGYGILVFFLMSISVNASYDLTHSSNPKWGKYGNIAFVFQLINFQTVCSHSCKISFASISLPFVSIFFQCTWVTFVAKIIWNIVKDNEWFMDGLNQDESFYPLLLEQVFPYKFREDVAK